MEPLTRTQVLIAMGVTAVVLLVVAKIWRQFDPIATLPVNWNPEALLLGVGLGMGITLASALIYQLWSQYRAATDMYLDLVLKPLLWPDLIWLGLLPGLSEELLFRGVMLPGLGLNWAGLAVSSICFGILHLSGRNQWPYAIWATTVGVGLGYSALVTGNLLVPVVAHIVTNLVTSTTWKFTHSNHQSVEKT